MAEPLYRDPAKSSKLQEAIQRGYIIYKLEADGVASYTLTQAGLQQYMFEKLIKP